ncbi:hypothetical protein [uncultured Polaribacter sp.]|uniref:hypothetical protein n=1 Tax=uncultured Polaribacter sp. TaxID=174711 RepID=UPI0026109FD2|nr:hypothetical protein [uncultured Polaribacter sp.]
MIKAKTQSIVALTYFIAASLLGIILRLFSTTSINANYKYIVHTHSHIALLGWVYIGLTTLIFHLLIKEEAKKKYSKLFIATQVTIIGMLISFPITGYALYSIIFSTLFLICSYWFFIFFRKNNSSNKESISFKFINTSLIFMVVSSIGPWALGGIMNTLGNSSHWYKNAIYFYLHFQYNGWFLFCLFGLFFYFLEKKGIQIHKDYTFPFYKYILISCILTVFLSFLWIKPPKLIYLLSTLGVVYQVIALIKLQLIINNYKKRILNVFTPFIVKLLKFVYLLFIAKVVLQFLTSIPYFSELTLQIKDFVIGYLHLIFLGITSISLLAFFYQYRLIQLSKKWTSIYLLGFILSEILIFYKGFCSWQQLSMIDNYFVILISVSTLMPIGILGIYFYNIKPTFSTLKESL